MKSLCGDSFGCTVVDKSQIGENWTCSGTLARCGLCMSMAHGFLELCVGDPVEFLSFAGDSGEWVLSRNVQDILEENLLFQALKPEMEAMRRFTGQSCVEESNA